MRFGFYSVRIYFDNPEGVLTYDMLSEMLYALGCLMQQRSICEASFGLLHMRGAGGVYIGSGRTYGGHCGVKNGREGDLLRASMSSMSARCRASIGNLSLEIDRLLTRLPLQTTYTS